MAIHSWRKQSERARCMTIANGSSDTKEIDFIFLGTGTSSTVPSISCLTDPENGCLCCRSTLTDKDSKNRRRNTAGVLRVKQSDGTSKTILIDCGKSVYAACVEWFPRYGLRRLNAVLLTHPHADAMNGLDDLRAWTLGGTIQEAVDIYCNQQTYKEVSRAFPYLVSREHATGGGDLPEFRWHIIDNDKPFDLCGVTVQPLPVHHGTIAATQEPFFCLGFLFDRRLAYLSDVSLVRFLFETVLGAEQRQIPESILEQLVPKESQEGIEVLVIDVLRIAPHASHFGIGQAMHLARQIKSKRTYWTGFAHRATQENWLHLAEAFEAGKSFKGDTESLGTLKAREFEAAAKAIPEDDLDAFTQAALQEAAAWSKDTEPIWARPAYDGLKLSWTAKGELLDSDDAS